LKIDKIAISFADLPNFKIRSIFLPVRKLSLFLPGFTNVRPHDFMAIVGMMIQSDELNIF